MNEVVAELAKKYPAGLFLQVEAEEQPDIAESFDIEAVPAFIILRGHTLLARISGADASALTKAVEKHVATPSYKPQSHTDQKAAPPPSSASPAEADGNAETPEELEKRLQALMNQRKVVLFMKGTPDAPRCGFSKKISTLLKEQNVDFAHFDILTDENVRQGTQSLISPKQSILILAGLKKLNDWPTFPQLIVKGELVGGLDIVQEMVDNGELKEAVA